MDKKHCNGCRNDFYNGNNPMGVNECWSLREARLVTKYRIHNWTPAAGDDHWEGAMKRRKIDKPPAAQDETQDCPVCSRPILPFWEDHYDRMSVCPGCGWRGVIRRPEPGKSGEDDGG